MSDGFFVEIVPVHSFEELASEESYDPLPDDWSVVVADVIGSTRAIEAGAYKEVNTVGVSVIAAVRNAVGPVEVPYVFGGDGALLCIPARAVVAVREAMAGTVAMASSAFGLELRAAVVPHRYVLESGQEVLVAKHQVSEHYVQCALFGGGAEFVEATLKSGGLPEEMVVVASEEAGADFTGLECRWSEVPSPGDETVALIVAATDSSGASLPVFKEVMERTLAIYGDAELCRPVSEKGLALSAAPGISVETRLKGWRSTSLARAIAELRRRLEIVVGWALMRFGIQTDQTDWGAYKSDLVLNTDFRKFDGTLRLVLSGSEEQRQQLTGFLEEREAAGELTFGVHVARAAVMTCIIDERQGDHVHFVDGAGGGYAMAAAAMKARGGSGDPGHG